MIKKGVIKFKGNIELKDSKENKISTNEAEYNEINKVFKTYGLTNISTSENYNIETSNIVLNKKLNFVTSKKPTIITDLENNIIKLENFEYQKEDKIFKSIGAIEITDKLNNSYQFSQLYIDTKRKK